jgi:hypothetical protein
VWLLIYKWMNFLKQRQFRKSWKVPFETVCNALKRRLNYKPLPRLLLFSK